MEEIRDREQEKIPKRNLIRFILLSTAGAVLFFAPVWEGNIREYPKVCVNLQTDVR